MNWEDKIEVKKGNIGEDIIQSFLENKGWIIYKPTTKNKAHFFDMVCTYNKDKIICIDVKTKARLNKWAAQGIDLKHYNNYIDAQKIMNTPFYIIFIDDKLGDVHLLDLTKGIKSFMVNEYIIAWYLKDMNYLFNIGDDKIKILSEFDSRNYMFLPK